ncbi:MAG: MGMT family protein [Acidobacteria bacterium]|nr:MGMT family protein [Acidobacteriota bacterium]MBI3662828.1 MGMT family protein [Acidobacteriota bacterium]
MPGKFTSRTPWREKLEKPKVKLPKIVRVPPQWRKQYGTGTMVIARPLDVDALIRTVRKGKLVTQTQLRERLARKYRVDHACPLTTGIFVRIIAEVAEEDRRAGKSRVTPYWRVVRDDGSLNEKLPGGPPAQARRLRAEGFAIAAGKGRKPPRVKEFDKYLARL